MAMGSWTSRSLHGALISSLLASAVILWCCWWRQSSRRASRCSELMWPLYLWNKNRDIQS